MKKFIAGVNCKGISFYKSNNRWVGEILINGKKIRKGFKTEYDALKFRKQMENIKYGKEKIW